MEVWLDNLSAHWLLSIVRDCSRGGLVGFRVLSLELPPREEGVPWLSRDGRPSLVVQHLILVPPAGDLTHD